MKITDEQIDKALQIWNENEKCDHDAMREVLETILFSETIKTGFKEAFEEGWWQTGSQTPIDPDHYCRQDWMKSKTRAKLLERSET